MAKEKSIEVKFNPDTEHLVEITVGTFVGSKPVQPGERHPVNKHDAEHLQRIGKGKIVSLPAAGTFPQIGG